MNRPIFIYWLIHPDQLFEGQSVRALGAEAQGGIHVLQHIIHLRVVNTPSKQNKRISEDCDVELKSKEQITRFNFDNDKVFNT